MLTIRHLTIITSLCCLSACNQAQNTTTTQNPPTPPASQPIAVQTEQPQVKQDHLHTLLATTINSGFLLSIRQNSKLSEAQRQCLANFDKNQSSAIAKELIHKTLTDEDIAEANDFYQQPIGQKLIAFNQEQATILQDVSGKTALKPASFSEDEQLQFGAFLSTKAGEKIQQLVNHDLPSAVAPLEQKQFETCKIPVEAPQQ